MEESERQSAENDINPRSPKRPRLSPIDDVNITPLGISEPSHMASDLAVGSAQPESAALPTAPATSAPAGSTLPSDTAKSTPPTGQNISPIAQARLDKLSNLSTLAGQVQRALEKLNAWEVTNAKSPAATTPNILEFRKAWAAFDPVYKLYTTGPAFIIPAQVSMTTPQQMEILSRANQIRWLGGFCKGEVGLGDMDMGFLFTFVPDGGRLLKHHGLLLLEVKTQGVVALSRDPNVQLQALVDNIFTDEVKHQIISRHPESPNLFPTEVEFLRKLAQRRLALIEYIRSSKIEELPIKYDWPNFTREITVFIAKMYGSGQVTTASGSMPIANGISHTNHAARAHVPGNSVVNGVNKSSGGPSADTAERPFESYPRLIPNNKDDWEAQLARAYAFAMQQSLGPVENTQGQQQLIKEESPTRSDTTKPNAPLHPSDPNAPVETIGRTMSPIPKGEISHTSQTAPTQTRYDNAQEVRPILVDGADIRDESTGAAPVDEGTDEGAHGQLEPGSPPS
jgi:hypothetical protein